MKHGNPFRFGDLALDDAFTNRVGEIDELCSDLRNGQNVALIAPRRYGKTSLLRRVEQTLVREGVLVAGVDLMKTPTKERLAGKLARAIHDEIASPLFRAKERLRLFSSLRVTPTVTVDPRDGTPSFTFTPTHRREDMDATLEHLFELPAQLAAERDRSVVLVFDEFQEITEIDPKLPHLLRAVFQEQPHVAHVYAGSRRDMMRRLFTDENEPFFRSAKVMELDVIEPALFAEFVEERFAATDRGLADGVSARLVAITRGHPYGTQELAYALWELVPEGFTASHSDLDEAVESVVRSENAHFTLAWSGASRVQRLVLQALAAEPGSVYGGGYRLRHDLPAASTVQRAVERLVADELVERRRDGGFDLAEPFLREWVLRFGS
ncbi:MAG TPA: ATP-binding protein [Gaiellaceae bacterium]|nr:ATP-binding protein [Gaiellaceae bacterium]